MSIARAILEFLDVPLAGAWDMPPEEALDFLRRKGLRTTFDYRDMLGDEHARAFTIAKMMDADLLATVQESLTDAVARGVPFEAWADSIVPTLQAKGWWGRRQVVDPVTGQVVVAQLGSPSRLQTIYRTNMQSAYAAGNWDAIEDQADLAPYLLYDAVDDHRTRPEHAAWDGLVLPITDPWWKTHYPPNGWNCRCSVIQLSAEEVADMGLVPARGAPKEKGYTWENPRTHKRERIPKGIDPGWNTNSGEARAKVLRDQADAKLKGYPAQLAQAAAKGFRAAIEAGKKAAEAAAGSATATNLGNLARMATRNTERAAAASITAALDAGGALADAIRAIRRTKAGKAMTDSQLLNAATERVRAARMRGRADLDGVDD